MKRILLLNYEFPPLGGGSSPISYEMTNEYAKAGYTVDVVTMGFRGLPKFEAISNNFHIYRVLCLRSKKGICHPWEQLTYLISAYFQCKKLLKKHTYDVCHTHFIIPTGALSLRLKKHFGLQYLITSHGSDVIGYDPRFKRLYPLLRGPWERIIDGAVRIVVPTEFLKGKILSAYPAVDHNKIKVIPSGIAPNKFKPLQKERVILSVGRLDVNKGIQDFLEAIKDMDLGGWSVVIVGDGPYRVNLEKLVEEYNLKNFVKFIGWIDNNSEEMKELYGKARIFISPSYFESFGLNVVEAMQAGAIPLISDIGAYRSLIDRDELFFKKDNSRDLQDKLQSLIMGIERGDIKEYDFTGVVKQRFEWPVIIKRYIKQLEYAQQIFMDKMAS